MFENQPAVSADVWSRWLLHLRHGGDRGFDRTIRADLELYADRVLDGAGLAAGMTLADIGTGAGLIAFRAIDRIGPSLKVLLTDISVPLLRHAQAVATERGVQQQCTFIECGADRLTGIGAASVDAVTTRAALAYVFDKSAALREFFRILKPGGRISLAEPVFQDDAFAACALKTLVDAQGPESPERIHTLLHRWKAAQFPDTQEKMAASPITSYSERTLFEWVRTAGFAQLHLELHIDLRPASIPSWQAFLASSPHPWAPPLNDIMAERFTAEERQFFEQVLRPLVESGQALSAIRTVYITAVKP